MPLIVSSADACGDDPGVVCEWVYDRTDNDALAGAADWFIGRPFNSVAILAVAWVLSRLAARGIRRGLTRVAGSRVVRDPRSSARASSIAGVAASTVSVIIWVLALILVIGQLGIDLAPLVAGAGIAGVALGFGAQSVVRDCLSGMFMIVEDQFGLGDIVDLGEASGVVERITLRTTVLRGQDGTVWHVPNGEVKRVGNRSQLWSVAVVDVAVPLDTDLDAVKAAISEVALEVCGRAEHAASTLEPPQLLGVENLTVDSASLRLLVKTAPGAQYDLQRALREAIKRRLDEMGVGAPLPGRALWSRLAGGAPEPR